MKSRVFVTTSNDETFFVLRNGSGFFEFYSLNQNYNISLRNSLFVNKYEFKSGALTADDRFLFLASYSLDNKFNVAKIDVPTQQLTFIADSDGSIETQMDFALFHPSYDRLVTLAKRKSGVFLQLRKFSTL